MDSRRQRLVDELVAAYSAGVFPMNDPRTGRISLYDPDPRAILPLREEEGLHVPRRLERRIRSGRFVVTSDLAFGEVVRACAQPRRESRSSSRETWIDGRLIEAYEALFEAGRAHSIEAWVEGTCPDGQLARSADEQSEGTGEHGGAGCHAGHGPGGSVERAWHAGARLGDPCHQSAGPRLGEARHRAAESRPGEQCHRVLVGGVFGVHIGGFFAGESMFSRPDLGGTDASKVCLVMLIRHLARRGFVLFDVQFGNPHLEQFGVRELPRREYKRRLREAVAREVEWGVVGPGS